MAATELVAGGEGLQDLQRKDQKLAEVIEFLETGILPEDKKRAKQLALTRSQYTLQDDVLFHVEMDATLRVIPLEESRDEVFHQAHGGIFGGHLRDAKVYSELSKHYCGLECKQT